MRSLLRQNLWNRNLHLFGVYDTENGTIFNAFNFLADKYIIWLQFWSILCFFVTKTTFEQNSNVEKSRKLRKSFLATRWQWITNFCYFYPFWTPNYPVKCILNQYQLIILEKMTTENCMKFNFGLNFWPLGGGKWKFLWCQVLSWVKFSRKH